MCKRVNTSSYLMMIEMQASLLHASLSAPSRAEVSERFTQPRPKAALKHERFHDLSANWRRASPKISALALENRLNG
jgi:hypothetical protein